MNYFNSHGREKAHLAPEPQTMASPMDSIKHHNYNSLGPLTKAATAILILSAAWNWIRWWSVTNLLLIQGLGKLTRNFPWLLPLQALMLRSFLGFDAVTFAAVVVFLVWVYGAYRNALALGSTGLTFTPGMAVGNYFVPIVHLWWPYQAMRETLLASQMPNGKPGAPKPRLALVSWWWGVLLVSGAAAWILNLQRVVTLSQTRGLTICSGQILPSASVPRPVLDRLS